MNRTVILLVLVVSVSCASEHCFAQADKNWLDNRVSNLAAEERGRFLNLPPVPIGDLQPGDILLKKDYRAFPDKSPVVSAQFLFRANRASKFTSHAILVVHANTHTNHFNIAEAIAENPSGVCRRDLAANYGPGAAYPDGASFLVYRCVDVNTANLAVAAATRFATDDWPNTQPEIGYSTKNCLGSFVGSSRTFGQKAMSNAEAITNGQRPYNKMMCSEFVTYCFQNGFNRQTHPNVSIELDAHRVAPIRLEEYLNSHQNFDFRGRLQW